MNSSNAPEPHAVPSPEGRLQSLLDRVGHLLPAQGPIGVFIHHNTLHAFQHLPFHEAVSAAGALFGAESYLDEAEYRGFFEGGRITEADLDAALDEYLDEEARSLAAEERRGALSRRAIARLALLHPLRAETAAGLVWRLAEEAGRAGAEATRALWEACRAVPLPPASPREPSLVDRVGIDRSHRDLLLALTGDDAAERIGSFLVRFLSAYLDEGVAHWAMPEREQGLWAAFVSMTREAPPVVAFLHGLAAEMESCARERLAPATVVLRALDELGVAEAHQEAYLTRVLLEAPGWAGMVHRLEHHPGDRGAGAPPVTLVELAAVRLTLSRYALREIARQRLGYEGPLAELSECVRRSVRGAMLPARSPEHERPYRLFQLVRVAGLSASEVEALSVEDRIWTLEVLEALGGGARQRVWHEAYERHLRNEVMGALAANVQRPVEARRVREPMLQLVCCMDDRSCGLRRHVEELSPHHETFGIAGFFGVPIRYRGLDDAGYMDLCPLGAEPAYEVVERPVEEALGVRRQGHRRRWARLLHALRHGTTTMARGVLLTPTLGVLSVVPLVARVLLPRTTAKLQAALSARLMPPPVTQLHSPEEDEGRGALRRLTAAEKASRVAASLENLGLVQGFAPLVVVLGHGSKSTNNPHQSAYDCGACGGRLGGPNARLFAEMANDPAARALLRERGIVIPETTWFIGGLHNTTTDGITLYDEHRVPASHHAALRAVKADLDEARKRHAHERCRRFASAPARLDPEGALAHVEARAEDLGQARPELGHATNAVAVIGRRELTRGLFLDRRAFLISYDPTQDPEGHILERILAAAGPVGAGINLEYYFSRVDNARYGCGTKLPHNLVSLLGVMEGTAGDLRTGLPRQMVEIHEPVRLLLAVETTPEVAAAICARQPVVRELVVNGWVQLVCVDPETGEMQRFRAGGFEPLALSVPALPEVARSVDWYGGKSGFVPPAVIRAAAADRPEVFHVAA
ncbi:YbcC family protein [Chondromyces crocatus]|uniref:Probable inorganic carbon transporter subunit DabA n=1 Tax=Chondromyces crocatus TaxID=52 RepID=A0A0K1E7A4_CHOCO|nr:DUF2309 domain-containing protein [Chondromyces crocatus]AKT36739.1 uncharacterized protein CMC5_008600 [Chondromyces crocatus]